MVSEHSDLENTVFTVYRYEKGKWEKVRGYAKVPKCLFPVRANSSKYRKDNKQKAF